MNSRFLFVFAGILLIVFLFVLFFQKSQTEVSQEGISLQDNLGQMLIIGFDGTEFGPATEELLREIHPGGVILLRRNIESWTQLRKLISDLQAFALKEMGRPLFIAVDQEGGEISRIPWVERASQAGLFDREEGYAIGQKRGEGLRSMGVNMNLAPVLDSAKQGDFIYGRSFQKNPEEAFPILLGLIEGHESKRVVSVIKHFPGYGGIAENPEQEKVPRIKSAPDTSLFKILFKEHPVSFVMVSHLVVEDMDSEYPFPFSQNGTKFLREMLGDNVLIMSDDLLSPALLSQYTLEDIGVQALQGGVNVLLAAGYPDAGLVSEFYNELWEGAQKREDLHSFIESSGERIINRKKILDPSRN